MHGRARLAHFALGFLAGALALHGVAELPSLWWSVAVLPGLVVAWRWPGAMALAGVVCGFAWVLIRAWFVLSSGLASEYEGVDVVLRGTVASVPEARASSLRFRMESLELSRGDVSLAAPRAVRLSWYGTPPEMVPGERWELHVRLRQPRGFQNPGGFDYEGWLFRSGIRATGYVRPSADNRRLEAATGHRVDRARAALDRFVDEAVPGSAGGLLRALSVGIRNGLDGEQWDVLRRTGTAHLMAISGLHVGMVAGMAWALGAWLWRLAGVPVLWLPARVFGAGMGFVAAAGYAALAGFSIPTQRALLMLSVLVGAILLRRPPEPVTLLAAVLLAVLVHDPLAVRSPALWLSFGAVASIGLAVWGRQVPERAVTRFGRVQVGVTIGLLPLLLVTFQGASLVSPVANALAVPVVGTAVVPLTLGGIMAAAVGAELVATGLLRAAAWVMDLLWIALAWLSALPVAFVSNHPPPAWGVVLAIPGVMLLLMPRGFPGRLAGLFLLVPLVLHPPPRPGHGELWLTVLDVGQGLAVVAHTATHTLVYDTGARFSPTFDAGSAAVVPYLVRAGVRRVDTLVISHADNDHIGGKASLLAALPVGLRLGGEPDAMTDADPCLDGQSWQWDGVRFDMLYPDRSGLSANDASCVLRIETAGGSSVLLAGDAERDAEHALVRAHRERLRSDVLIVPHHGSRTSSTPALLNAVQPVLAVNSSGYRNAFGHPHEEVVTRYRQRDIPFIDTADSGAVSVRFTAQGHTVTAYRFTHRRFWFAGE